MGQPSFPASNALIYLTYGAFLVLGTGIAWRMRNQSKQDFLNSNGTQSGEQTMYRTYGQRTRNDLKKRMETRTQGSANSIFPSAFPLALNFIASALGAGILFSYPELATITGVQGVVVYALASALPMLVFGALGPIIRRKCPEGFVLTEWTRQRYGTVAMLYLSFMTLVTLFLYMVAELSALGQVVNTLTGIDGLPVIIVECVITTIYTSLGGFKISFLTDVIQGGMVVGLIIIATITVGAKTEIKRELIDSSHLLEPSLLGWQLLYILPVAVLTNDFFLSSFWLRTFSSKSDRDLWIGVSVAMAVILCILTLVGCTGLIAAWSGAWPGEPEQAGSLAFFLLLQRLPSWVVGVVLVMVVSLSTAAFDSLQSAMVSSASNDLFRNRLNIWYIRGMVVVIIIPVVVVALRASSILQIYLISDLLSAATIPVLCLGLSDRLYWWRGFEVVVGGLGGILTVFIFGAAYYKDARRGAQLLLIQNGLYANDWSAFGAFVAAPVGGIAWGFAALALRLSFQYVRARVRREPFDALDRPPTARTVCEADMPDEVVAASPKSGKFF
ncbi:urea transporter [Metarhizium album ARSEF 1941]|uniref:Urea transporter n=1 Tax=Metarhizium album (strain ARSEF 1941) TaxID=1081103 RepID=A0A0B2X5D4_METAS|nr:urea transporter [Metarhizium album ARSEF 1941]KHO00968.1 urea transporter [Metarhizium album ARSEF 1941]